MLKVSQVASRLNLSQAKVYELIEGLKLGHYRMDGAIRVSEEQLREFLERSKQEPETPQRAPRPRLKHIKL